MRQLFIITISCFFYLGSNAQSHQGLTGIRDTSYSIENEYKKHIRNYPEIRIAEGTPVDYIIEKKNVLYCKTGKRELKIDMYYQLSYTKDRPVIIFIHGGGWRSGDKEMHAPLLRELAALGYFCISPEYRLSTEALFPAAIHDIKSVIRWVRRNARQLKINPNRICVAGHSAGGEIAAFIGATNGKKEFEGEGCEKKYSSKANAVIDIDGTLAFIHPESGEGDDSKKTSAGTYWFGFSKTENPGLWKQAAPLTQAGKQNPPILFINSGVARMHAGRDDFIKIINQHSIYNEVKTLEAAPHTFIFFHPWFDTTVAYMDRFLQKVFPYRRQKSKSIVVAKDGTGDFLTLRAAVDYISKNKAPRRIFVKKGIYEEKILIDSTLSYLTIEGENKMNTVISFDDHTGKLSSSGDTINTRTSWTFKIEAANFTATDITFRNNAGFSAGQAVAVESDGDEANFYNCRFIGNQDVLFTNGENSKQFFRHCYIEGTTDFIFGSSTVFFEKCTIYSKKNSHITAASTPEGRKYGYVFSDCVLLGDTSLHNVSLGRPWRPYANVVYLNCYMGPHIKAEGWSNWNNTDNYKTARFAEYHSYGPGANPLSRLPWTKQLSGEQARLISPLNVFGRGKWY
jgi:pectin methylesterase-like acyl-CoA thioesterase/acetyl esterase/lipase